MWTNPFKPYDILSEEQVAQIHNHAMLILQEIGVDFLHPRAIDAFRRAGLTIEDSRVRFERAFVEEQIKKVPETFEVQARNSKNTVTIGGNHMVNAPVYGPPFITDLDRGRRNPTIADFTNFDKMAQATPQIHCAGGTIVEPEDLPLETRHLDMVYSHMRWTDMPFMGSVISEEGARDSIEMSSILFGGRANIEKTPALLALVNVNSPLRYDDRMLGALITYAEANQPVIATPFLMAGAMSPMGLAGTMGILASAQMARHYRIPFRGGGALTSSKSPDAQAAYESMMCLWPTVMGGVHFVLHAAGWLESALLASYEKFIIDVETLRMFEWMLTKGIPFDEEGFAMDGIREVGPGGHHLGSEHTMRHYRTGFYRPWISSTENYDRWQRMGSRTADRVANEKWKQLLADYKDPGIDSAVDEQLKTFIEVRKDAILHARV